MRHRIIDAFPFFNELDVLEIRLQELDRIVDHFVIAECHETYGGQKKPLYLGDNWPRYKDFHHKIKHVVLDTLEPQLKHTLFQNVPGVNANNIRTEGRQREAFARDAMYKHILALVPQVGDFLSFGDCDEIPRAEALLAHTDAILGKGIHRLKQNSYYFNVNTLVDYGRDVCSRARVGRIDDLVRLGSLYAFRMAGNKQADFPAIENGGWHFSYFGGDVVKLQEKVAALNPFLAEYKLFGNHRLVEDVLNRKDIHHRPTAFSELPETFQLQDSKDPQLPKYYLENLQKFEAFTVESFRRRYGR